MLSHPHTKAFPDVHRDPSAFQLVPTTLSFLWLHFQYPQKHPVHFDGKMGFADFLPILIMLEDAFIGILPSSYKHLSRILSCLKLVVVKTL